MMRFWLLIAVAAMALAVHGCEVKHNVAVEPVEIKPIHITMDINIKVDREVDAFFSDVEKKAAELSPPGGTQPSTGDKR